MNREYHQWYSHRLHRNMELLVFGHGGQAVLFFPPRMGRFYDYENWGLIEALRHRISNGELQLFCVDSVDTESLYNGYAHPADRINRHLQYEQYILHEVIPLMHGKSPNNYLQVAGCSMGAYHALNLAMKHPWHFKKVVAMSGRYDLTKGLEHFRDLFDGYHDENIYFNMPRQYVPNLCHEHTLSAIRNMEIILAIGQTDPFFGDNREFSEMLWHKGLPNQFYIWDNEAHKARYWRQMVQIYL